MKTKTHPLLKEIRAFLKNREMSDWTFGFKSCRDGRLIERLSGSGDVGTRKAQRIRDWMASESEAA